MVGFQFVSLREALISKLSLLLGQEVLGGVGWWLLRVNIVLLGPWPSSINDIIGRAFKCIVMYIGGLV